MLQISKVICLYLIVFLCGFFSVKSQAEDLFKFGVMLPLTGPLAEFGVAFQNGIKLASVDNADIAKKIQLLVEDNKYDPRVTISIARSLKDVQNVHLIYNWGGNPSGGLVPVAEQNKIPLMIWSADDTLALNKNYVVRFINPANDFAQTLWEYLEQKGFKNIKVFPAQNAYIASMTQALINQKPKSVMLDVDESVPMEMTDVRSLVTKLKSQNYDAVGVYLGSGQIENFYREFAKQRLNIFTFGTDFFESENLARQAGSAINGAVFVNHPVNKDFAERYLKEFGNDVQMPSACLGYDLVNFIYQVFKDQKSKSLTPEKIMNLLRNENLQFKGISGNFRFRKTVAGDNYYELPLAVRQIRDFKLIDAEL